MPQILVEFVPDFTKLEGSLDALVKSGMLTQDFANAFRDAQRPVDELASKIRNTASSTVESLGKMDDASKKLATDMVGGLLEGMNDGLREAGVSWEELKKKLVDPAPTKSTSTLKQELRKMKEELAQLAVQGKKNTDQYRQMAAEAAKLEDAIGDVSQSVRRLSSDTRGFDTMISAVQGVTSAFSIASGAMSLLGRSGMENQEAIERLNAVMAISIGLQQLKNLTEKESLVLDAIIRARTAVRIALEGRLATAILGATAAQKLANLAMSASPIGILLTGIGLLALAFSSFGGKVKKAEADIRQFNTELEIFNRRLEDSQKALESQQKIDLDRMKERGATAQQLHDKEMGFMAENSKRYNYAAVSKVIRAKETYGELISIIGTQADAEKNLADLQLFLADDVSKKMGKAFKKRIEGAIEALKDIRSTFGISEAIGRQIAEQKQSFKTAEADRARANAKAAADEAKRARERAAELAKQQRADDFASAKNKTELELKLAAEGSAEQLRLRKKLLLNQLQIDLENEKLTINERILLIKNYYAERDKLEVEDANKRIARSRENTIAILKAQLSAMGVSAKEKELLTEALLNQEREKEIAGEVGNLSKIKEINARFDKEIAEARFQIRREALDKELALEAEGVRLRRKELEKIIATSETESEARLRKKREESALANQDAVTQRRVAAVDELLAIDLKAIDKEKKFYTDSYISKLITAQEFADEIERLNNESVEKAKDAEDKKTAIAVEGADKRRENFQKDFENIANQFLQGFNQLNALTKAFSEARIQRVNDELEDLKRLKDANTISDKEYAQRTKQLEEQRKRLQREAAVREKSMAIFQATINGAVAVVKAIGNPFAVAAAVALVAAQIAAISAKPIPKFGKGTKSAPKGLAEVGETGTEIIQKGRSAVVVEKHQLMWLEGGERIYSPKETAEMLPKMNMQVVKFSGGKSHTMKIDYDRLGKSIGDEIKKHPRSVINLDENGFTTHLMEKSNMTTYRNKRYTFNG